MLWPKHQISVTVLSASAGAVCNVKALALTLIASGAAVGFLVLFDLQEKEQKDN